MQYKTIVLELLQQHPESYRRLRQQRRLPATLNRHAMELKDYHEAWIRRLKAANPTGQEDQLKSQALELALADLQHSLPNASPPNASPPSDEARFPDQKILLPPPTSPE